MILGLLLGCPGTPSPPSPTPTVVPSTPTPTGDTAPPPTPPIQGRNVLVVLLDDLTIDRIARFGVQGAHAPQTPVIDALADQGRVFRRAYTNPICSPTRAALLTGRRGYRTGIGSAIFDGDQTRLDDEEVTLPEQLRAHGDWSTGAFGKWHLASLDTAGAALTPNAQGFQEYDGALKNIPTYNAWLRTHNGVTTPSNTYVTQANVRRAGDWMQQAPEPWLAYVALHAAHEPLHVPELPWRYSDPPTDPTFSDLLDLVVESADVAVGRLLAALDPEVRARTWVVVLADNGTTDRASVAPNDPHRSKATVFEGGIRVPLIIAGPGIPPGDTDALADVTDLFPTLLELTGTPLPDDVVIDGVSLVPVLHDPDASVRSWVYQEMFAPNLALEGPRVHRAAILDGNLKIRRDEHGATELFRLDPDLLLEQPADDLTPAEQTAAIELLGELVQIDAQREALWSAP